MARTWQTPVLSPKREQCEYKQSEVLTHRPWRVTGLAVTASTRQMLVLDPKWSNVSTSIASYSLIVPAGSHAGLLLLAQGEHRVLDCEEFVRDMRLYVHDTVV